MGLHERLFELEEGFWKGDAGYYEEHLAEECLMVFAPPVGIIEREAIIQSIAESERWIDVHLTTPVLLEVDGGAALLTYLAAARRETDEEYVRVVASSLYVPEDGDWKLAFHQQTPA